MIHILCIDDEPELLTIAHLFLGKEPDFFIFTAEGANSGYKILTSEKIDVILLDLMMPEIDGLTFLKRIRSEGITVPVIVFTGRNRRDSLIDVFTAGADAYVQKGTDVNVLFCEVIHKIRSVVQLAREKAAKQLSEQRFHVLAEQVDDIIMMILPGSEPKITYINSAIWDTLSYTTEEMVRIKNIFESVIFEEDYWDFYNLISKPVSEEMNATVRCKHKDGSFRWINFRFYPIPHDDGTEVVLLGIARDLTLMRESTEKLLRVKALLSEAQSLSKIGNFEYDLAEDISYWSDEMYHIFEYDIGSKPVSYLQLESFIVEEDRERISPNIHEIVLHGGFFESKCRIMTKNGNERWIWVKFQVGASTKGSGIRLFGVVQDITEKIEMEELKRATLTQIKRNIEQMAIINDEIRNPLSVIMGLAEIDEPEHLEEIRHQVALIDELIGNIDKRWDESIKVNNFIRTHYLT